MMYALGGEREVNGEWLPLSDDLYCFDTECVEDEDIYAQVIQRLAHITKGVFDISDISSRVEHDNRTAGVSFVYHGEQYDWPLQYNEDWFDCELVDKINALLKLNGSDQFFYVSAPDQNLHVIFGTKANITKINQWLTVPFRLAG